MASKIEAKRGCRGIPPPAGVKIEVNREVRGSSIRNKVNRDGRGVSPPAGMEIEVNRGDGGVPICWWSQIKTKRWHTL